MPIVILFLSANPAEGMWLKVDQEAKEIDRKLAESKNRDQFELMKEPGVSVDDIQYLLLQRQPNIVHFSGHGEVDAIYLQGPDGHAQKLSEKALANLFAIVNKDGKIRCVVLNACYSEEQAAAIAQHVDCVIGMARAVSDEGARGFAASFYQGLAFGKSVKDSFLLGTNYLAMIGVPDEDVPKLHTRQGVDAGQVFIGTDAGSEETSTCEVTTTETNPPPFSLLGSWDASGYMRAGYYQSPVTMRVIFYQNGTFEESGSMAGSPFYARGSYNYDPARSLLIAQAYSAPMPTPFFLSDVTSTSFTATAQTGVLSFRKSG